MRNAPIVPGSMNPFHYRVRPYPTRFHGAIYTRPVFGAEQGRASATSPRPFQRFTPSYDMDREISQPTLSGLGAVNSAWDTGRGVFNRGGQGGGVFDGNISGLGSLTAPRRAPLGILDNLFGDDAADYPWKSYSDKTKALQGQLNLELIGKQKCALVVDGKLGAGTCGAMRFLGKSAPSTCQSFTDPSPLSANCSQPAATAPVTTTTTVPQLESGMSSSTKRALGFAIGGLLAVGAVVVMRKKR